MELPDSDPHLQLVNILLSTFTGEFSLGILLSLLIIILLLMCSALISGAEIAYFSLTPAHLKEIKSKEIPVNKLILAHLKSTQTIACNNINFKQFCECGDRHS